MKRLKTLVVGAVAVLTMVFVGYMFFSGQSHDARAKQGQRKIAGKYDFSKISGGDWIETDWYSWGEAVSDTETVAGLVGRTMFTARLLDGKYAPVVRWDKGFGSVAVVYPNGVVLTAVPQKPNDPGMDFAETANWLNKRIQETGSSGRAVLRNNGPYKGLVMERGKNNIGGEKVPYGGSVQWYRDGVLYNLVAPPEIPQDEVEKIAASAL